VTERKIVWVDPFTISVPDIRAKSAFTEEEYESLKLSISQSGLKVPIQCFEDDGGELWLAEGESRLAVACELKLGKVPVEIVGKGGEREARLWSMATSLKGRPDWVSIAYAAHHAVAKDGVKASKIARMLGKDKSTLQAIMSLTTCGPDVQAMVRSGLLSYRHAYEVHFIQDSDVQAKVAHRAREGRWSYEQTRGVVNAILEYYKSGLDWRSAYQKAMRERYAHLRAEGECSVCRSEMKREDLVVVRVCPNCYAKVTKLVGEGATV